VAAAAVGGGGGALDALVADVEVEVVVARVDGCEAVPRPGRVGREGRALGVRLGPDAVGEGPRDGERVNATGDEPGVSDGGVRIGRIDGDRLVHRLGVGRTCV